MEYVCPTCGEKVPRDLLVFLSHTEDHIVDVVKRQHPDWIEGDGFCKRCYNYYKNELTKD